MKIKCNELAVELGYTHDQLMQRAALILKPEHTTGKGKSTWFTEEGADLLRQEKESPLTVSKRHKARCVHEAPNKRWVYCVIDGHGKRPVLIPRRLTGHLVGKTFMVEAVRDTSGITFRHEHLAD